MAGRIDHSTISFTTDNGIGCFHFRYNVYFANGRSIVFHTVFTGYITQGTSRAQVGYRIARSMLQHIVGHSNQCIFFTVHHTIFANHRQTVNVRVYHKCHIRFSPFHQVHDVSEILFKRLRVVLEVSGRFTI